MSETINLICFKCKHFDEYAGGCAAFKEIPDKVLRKNKHDKPLKGQKNKLVFEPVENEL